MCSIDRNRPGDIDVTLGPQESLHIEIVGGEHLNLRLNDDTLPPSNPITSTPSTKDAMLAPIGVGSKCSSKGERSCSHHLPRHTTCSRGCASSSSSYVSYKGTGVQCCSPGWHHRRLLGLGSINAGFLASNGNGMKGGIFGRRRWCYCYSGCRRWCVGCSVAACKREQVLCGCKVMVCVVFCFFVHG